MARITVSDVEVDEDGNVGFYDPKSGCFITDPSLSSCGRFEVDPQLQYDVDPDVVAMIGNVDDSENLDLRFSVES